MRRLGRPFVLLVALWMLPAGHALAHAERVGSTPEEGARLRSAPTTLNIRFSEPPIGDANFEVVDGCERDLVENIDVQGTEITATLAEGQPGSWNVRTQVVSGIDGHATKDRWRFQVSGRPDCENDPGPRDSAGGSGGDDEAEQGESFPLLAFAAGTLIVIVVALLLRGRSAGA